MNLEKPLGPFLGRSSPSHHSEPGPLGQAGSSSQVLHQDNGCSAECTRNPHGSREPRRSSQESSVARDCPPTPSTAWISQDWLNGSQLESGGVRCQVKALGWAVTGSQSQEVNLKAPSQRLCYAPLSLPAENLQDRHHAPERRQPWHVW